MFSKRWSRLVVLIVLVSISAVAAGGAARATATATAAGMQTLVSAQQVSYPVPASLRTALGAIEQLSEFWPNDFGPAWYDPSTGGLVLDVVTQLGGLLATAAFLGNMVTFTLLMLANPPNGDISADKVLGSLASLVPAALAGLLSQRSVARSLASLINIRDSLTTLESGYPITDNIWMSRMDPPNNQVIVTVDTLSSYLTGLLTTLYGTAVTTEVLTDTDPFQPVSRWWDNSPFWGGSHVIMGSVGCTDAFSWISGSTYMMLTAGHCIYNGGTVITQYESMGTVAEGTRENWGPSGTEPLEGSTTNRGDMALITIYSGKSSSGYIYVGNSESNTGKYVAGMRSSRAQIGDEVCTGGAARLSDGSAGPGEICGWTVDATRINYEKSPGVWWRNVVTTEKQQGWCNRPGDSGAPVYYYSSGGGSVYAEGILDGASGGGSDFYGGTFDQCRVLFTDIWDAYYGLPGVIRT